MLLFKAFKYRYRKTHQRSRFKNFRYYKTAKKSAGFGRIQVISKGKVKSCGGQLASAFLIANRQFKKRKRGFLWTPLFHDRLDFRKTKGVRMGGGRGKHYTATLKFYKGSILFEGWLSKQLLRRGAILLRKAVKRLSVPSKIIYH